MLATNNAKSKLEWVPHYVRRLPIQFKLINVLIEAEANKKENIQSANTGLRYEREKMWSQKNRYPLRHFRRGRLPGLIILLLDR